MKVGVTMEDPLLPSGSGRRGGGESSAVGRRESGALNNVLVGRRGEAITKGDNYQKAAAMVDQVFSLFLSTSLHCSTSNRFHVLVMLFFNASCRLRMELVYQGRCWSSPTSKKPPSSTSHTSVWIFSGT